MKFLKQDAKKGSFSSQPEGSSFGRQVSRTRALSLNSGSPTYWTGNLGCLGKGGDVFVTVS